MRRIIWIMLEMIEWDNKGPTQPALLTHHLQSLFSLRFRFSTTRKSGQSSNEKTSRNSYVISWISSSLSGHPDFSKTFLFSLRCLFFLWFLFFLLQWLFLVFICISLKPVFCLILSKILFFPLLWFFCVLISCRSRLFPATLEIVNMFCLIMSQKLSEVLGACPGGYRLFSLKELKYIVYTLIVSLNHF